MNLYCTVPIFWHMVHKLSPLFLTTYIYSEKENVNSCSPLCIYTHLRKENVFSHLPLHFSFHFWWGLCRLFIVCTHTHNTCEKPANMHHYHHLVTTAMHWKLTWTKISATSGYIPVMLYYVWQHFIVSMHPPPPNSTSLMLVQSLTKLQPMVNLIFCLSDAWQMGPVAKLVAPFSSAKQRYPHLPLGGVTFFCVPSYISGVHHFWWDFCVRDCFFFFFFIQPQG